MGQRMWALYQRILTGYTLWVLIGLVLVIGLLATQARHFSLDASADALLLEDDEDLALFRETAERYGAQDFLVMTYTPPTSLFSDASLTGLEALRDDLRDIRGVDSVLTVLDVPLLSNPPVPMTELVSNIKTLEDPETDVEMARTELANSPLYVNLLLNLEENTTALQINLPRDTTRDQLLTLQASLTEQAGMGEVPESIAADLERVDAMLKEQSNRRAAMVHETIASVREVMAEHQDEAQLFLGGVPMIADDIITFVRNDLITFGLGVLFLLIATLTVIFRQPRWVIMPLLCCSAVVVTMLGILGLGRWPVTVISSNFISLLLILTLSMSIHLIVRYRELLRKHHDWDQAQLVMTAVKRIAVPCLYMALTTGVAFMSLLFSGIRPVINFGWMMSLGIACAFLVTFSLFPALLMLAGKDQRTAEKSSGGKTTRLLARITLKSGNAVLVTSLALAAFTVIGITRLVVENSFIDYFDQSTDIYQGMTVIDERLGGTTPLEVLINFEDVPERDSASQPTEAEPEGFVDEGFVNEGFAEDDGFVDEGFGSGGASVGSFRDDFGAEDDPEKYWYTQSKVARIKAMHRYLDEQPETGKVLSLATMIEIAEGFNDNEALTNVQLALLYTVIPSEFRDLVIDPYVSVEHNQARLNVRILDSMDGLKRNAFLERIEREAVDVVGFEPGQIQLTGMMVLYNNMLQSLFGSQILTLGVVFLGILLMFLILFRSVKLSLLAMAPNLLAATFVLGIMGWFGIPLDMMTITIASITIGMAVDNTIHYLVRYQREFAKDGDYVRALSRSHNTIGKAMFYTSLTIILGFSILMMSNFRPTLYFGLLTALAMAVALLGSLTLLPRLIVLTRPFGTIEGHHRTED
ncbi:efflux RND transporter permease subunit [Saccharospirillum alexandrii]|uniref:efflux RND transporter permease subunit n=1 Tax=Saccharospirillum alexandrii TaxID=2448477 RepID=UPI000FD7B4F8|nr:MMPL family transporter [Saccharospirillum alexandrii]